MNQAFELRRYLTRAGRDVWAIGWLNSRKSEHAPGLWHELIGLLPATLAIVNHCAEACSSCESTADRAIGFITRWPADPVCCCFVAEINANNSPTSSARWSTSRTIGKGHHETQGEHIARRGHGSRITGQSGVCCRVLAGGIGGRRRTERAPDRSTSHRGSQRRPCQGGQSRRDCARESVPCLVSSGQPAA